MTWQDDYDQQWQWPEVPEKKEPLKPGKKGAPENHVRECDVCRRHYMNKDRITMPHTGH